MHAFKCISEMLAHIWLLNAYFGPKCKFCTIYALNIFKYQKYVFIIILTRHKSIIVPEKDK